VLIARWLAQDPLALRRSFGRTWTFLRRQARGLPPVLPRIWHI
jgi:urease accessory protein